LLVGLVGCLFCCCGLVKSAVFCPNHHSGISCYYRVCTYPSACHAPESPLPPHFLHTTFDVRIATNAAATARLQNSFCRVYTHKMPPQSLHLSLRLLCSQVFLHTPALRLPPAMNIKHCLCILWCSLRDTVCAASITLFFLLGLLDSSLSSGALRFCKTESEHGFSLVRLSRLLSSGVGGSGRDSDLVPASW
jgi:hypothetical protein